MRKKVSLLFIASFLLFTLPVLADDKKIESIEDQSDINATNLEKLQEKVDMISNSMTPKLFGSLGLRSCLMSTNILTDPQNIQKNMTGMILQTRIAIGLAGKASDSFNYQVRVLTSENNSFNISWLPTINNLPKMPLDFDRFVVTYEPVQLLNTNHNFKFNFGKAQNFLPETELLFDEDVSFIGLSQQYTLSNISPALKKLSLGFAENVPSIDPSLNNSYMFAGKLSGEISIMDNLSLNLGGSYITYPSANNLVKYNLFQGVLGGVSRENRITNNTYDSAFNLANAFFKLDYNITPELPLQLYTDFVNNFGANDKNKGYMVGFNLGNIKKEGDWSLNYNYKSLDQDYNLSLVVQDQIGGTDVAGHGLDFSYQIAPKTRFILTMQNRQNLSKPDTPQMYIIYPTLRQDF